jgi:hypothetical protein
VKILPKAWSEFLTHEPETGMGYQVMAIMRRDGRKIGYLIGV